ncbi:MAG: S41 family peptidase [Bacteroidales bacterium]|nr:S41 family peptidase [Bacteroidales bacterium]
MNIYIKQQIIAAVCFLLISVNAFAQEKQLTKQQMYEDFDELVAILQDCNPQLSIRKYVTGVDQMELVYRLRFRIDTITSYYSFITKVLNHALVCMYDIHANMASSVYPSDNLEGIDVNAIDFQNQYLQRKRMEKEQIFDQYRPFCNPAYINGDYYMTGTYLLINRNAEDTLILNNVKLLKYAGVSYSEYVQQYAPLGMRWDNKRKQYYAISSYFPARKDTLTVVCNGETIDIPQANYHDMLMGSDAVYLNSVYDKLPRYNHSNQAKVFYFEKDKVLYVYLDKMADENGQIADKIKELGNGKPIGKVIIDVRNNSGGDDLAWRRVLQAIVADTLPDIVKSALKNSERNRRLYSDGKVFGNLPQLPAEQLPTLTKTDEAFIIAESAGVYFIPDTNSLNYRGRIYIIQNEQSYSSAQAFSSYAQHIDQLVSVGVPTGMLGGRGIAPALFQLKHSKFSFRLETLLDITNAETPYQVYQDMPEILIDIPTEEKRRELNHHRIYDLHSKEYLYQYDYTFKKILEME